MAPAQNANYRFNDYVAKITSMKEILRAPDFRNIGSGEIGGKARGLSVFVDALQEEKERLAKEFGKEIFIAVPKATVIRTSVFEEFVGKNNLWSIVRQNLPNDEIDKAFLAGKFSSEAIEQFDKLLEYHERPIAVRSSHILEDAERKPWSGIFGTFIIPNAHASIEVRREQLMAAIKLVFASTYHERARTYAKANHMLGGESAMAVLVQNVAGRRWQKKDGCTVYYPEVSFAAFSYNQYATDGINPNDGVMRLACGLGKGTVDERETSVIINLGKPDPIVGISVTDKKSMSKYAPKCFWALDLERVEGLPISNDPKISNEDAYLKKLGIHEDGNEEMLRRQLNWVSWEGGVSDMHRNGYAPVTLFKNIIGKQNSLVRAVNFMKDILYRKFGMIVDIEGAADFLYDNGNERSIIYPVQGRTQVKDDTGRVDALASVLDEKKILEGRRAVGPGNKEIWDILIVPQEKFSFGQQSSYAAGEEIRRVNLRLSEEFPDKKYMLIVPGRLGSTDPFLGIGGNFEHVSHASVISELSLGRIDSSQGLHFFQSLVSSKVSVLPASEYADLRIGNLIKYGQIATEGEYVVHYHMNAPLRLEIDTQRNYVIYAQ